MSEPKTMRLHGHIRYEVNRWPSTEWPIMCLETAEDIAEDIFRQYKAHEASNKCILLMAVVDVTENWYGHHSFITSRCSGRKPSNPHKVLDKIFKHLQQQEIVLPTSLLHEMLDVIQEGGSRFAVTEVGDVLTISMIGIDGDIVDSHAFVRASEDRYDVVGQLCSRQHTIDYAKEVLRRWAAIMETRRGARNE